MGTCEIIHESIAQCEQLGFHADTVTLRLAVVEAHLRAESYDTAQLYAEEARALAEQLNFDVVCTLLELFITSYATLRMW